MDSSNPPTSHKTSARSNTEDGGHEDQLSRKYWGMDRWRVYALEKLLQENKLDREQSDRVVLLKENRLKKEQKDLVVTMLIEKCEILINGFGKRGKNSGERTLSEPGGEIFRPD